MYLLARITPYNSINLLYDEKKPAGNRIIKTSIVSLPFPVFLRKYKKLWKEIYAEILSSVELKKEIPTRVVVNLAEEWYNKIPQSKNLKVVSPSDALSSTDIPIVYVGERRVYLLDQIIPSVITGNHLVKWFDFDERVTEIENFWRNRLLYGPKPIKTPWEKSFEESLLREKIYLALKIAGETFLSKVEEFYLSGEAFTRYSDIYDIVLMTMDAIDIEGFWTLHFDHDFILGPLTGLAPEKKDNILQAIKSYKFTRAACVFVVPSANKAYLKGESDEGQVLNLNKEGVFVVPLEETDNLEVKIKIGSSTFEKKVLGSKVGIVFDTRKRPLTLPNARAERLKLKDNWKKQLKGWNKQ